MSSIPYFAHTLNVVVKKALCSIDDVVVIRKKCRRIVSYFKSSCLANDKLCEMQNVLNVAKHKLILEVKTRWNSTYQMFERFLEQKQTITAALSYYNATIDTLLLSEWELISECILILKPFFLLTTKLSSECNVCISKLIISVKQLYICLNANQNHILSVKLKEMMYKYFDNIENNPIYAMATLLNPRFKLLRFQSPENAK